MNAADEPRPEIVPTREGYDRWAEIYDDEQNPLVVLEERFFPPLLGDVRGLDVVDIGAGTGRGTIPLVRGGARVTAVDFSDGMIARAKRRPEWGDVRFIEHDLHRPLPFADASFDRVVSRLVLDHIQRPGGLIGELGRVCRPDGFVLLSIMHPAMMLRGVQARFRDPESGAKIAPRSAANEIADYVNGALAAGLRIDHFSEHRFDEEAAATCPRGEKYVGWPILMLMRLRAG